MGAEIITTDQTSQYVIGSSDFVVLMAGVTLTIDATTDPGFLAAHDGINTLTVHGQAVTSGSTVVIGSTSSATMLASVTVGAGGLLQSLTDHGVEMQRSGSRIDNDGTISGGNGGVTYAAGVTGATLVNAGTLTSLLGYGVSVTGDAGGTLGLFDITNTGVIETETDGVTVASESLVVANHGQILATGVGIALADDASLDNTLTLTNTGLIQGASTAIDATGHDDSVTNTGTIIGAVLLEAGDNTVDNAGRVSGPVTAGAGADTLVNSGEIDAAVDLGGGANIIRNAGELTTLSTGTGDDTFTNEATGVVSGTLTLGDGANAVTNHGHLGSGLTFGAGDDTLLSTGTVTGDVALGDGTNTARLSGAVLGAVSAGTGDDSLFVLAGGQITGPVSLGAGANAVTNDGHLASGLSFGSGDDTLHNTGRITGDVVLGDGGNTATVNGRIEGAMTGGTSADIIVIRGRLDGDLTLDSGADSLRLKGEIDGAIDMGTGSDVVVLGAAAAALTDTLDGGSGDDTLETRIEVEDVFNFELINLKGGDAIGVVADGIANTVLGNRAGNEIDGGQGDDDISGHGGADTLIGGDGADTIKGGRGADVITGGKGADILTGGRGRDIFAFDEHKDSRKNDPDRILDFDRGRDDIDLSAVAAGDIAWLGTDSYSKSGAPEARYKVVAEGVEIRIDLDGNGKNNMVILVDGIDKLTGSDFLL